MSKDNGGPAFPWGEHGDRLGGMTLRDYFAGQVAAGECAGNTATRPDPKSLAAFTYEVADAMLAERAKGGVE